MRTTAKVTVDAARVLGPLARRMHGQFIEHMFGGVAGGLSAELLRDRGFDEPASPRLGVALPWERDPDDRNEDAGFTVAQDAEAALPLEEIPEPRFVTLPSESPRPRFGLRIAIAEDDGRRRGLAQPRIPIHAGKTYRASVWARAGRNGYRGRIVVALEADRAGGPRYAAASIDAIGDTWRRHEVVLAASASDPLAKLALLFEGEGELHVDEASLVPTDAGAGLVRTDVLDRLRALTPGFLRWPGGNVAQDYRWLFAVGDRDRRQTWTNLSWQDAPEPADFGTAEYLALARALGTEPTICVNLAGRGATAAEAAAWVEYVNGATSTRWGALRASHGHAEPWNVRWWELGNEVWGHWVRGHADAETYARRALEYVHAMRAVAPEIRLIAVGDNDESWNRTVLSILGPHVDALAVHHYYGREKDERDPRDVLARPLAYERFYDRTRTLIRELAPDRPLTLAINEWNVMLPGPVAHGMLAATFAARMMNVLERCGDLVSMACVSDAVNGWNGGIVQAARHHVFVTGPYHANALWASRIGDERLHADVDGPSYDAPTQGRDVPSLDVAVSRDGETGRVYVKLVNADVERDLEIELGGTGGTRVALERIVAESPDAIPSFERPDAIRVAREDLSGGRLVLPACSASVVTIEP